MNNGLNTNEMTNASGITTLNFSEMPTGITTDVITKLIEKVASKVYQKAKGFFVNSIKKREVDIGTAFREYLEYSVTIHNEIKTLLYKDTPKPIYSVYECVGLETSRHETIDTSDINNVLAVGNKLIVSGTGGSGKSVMLQHLFLSTVRNTDYIPVLIQLRGLNDYQEQDLNLEEYIYNRMRILQFKLEEEYFKYSLETGCYVILLDGFDEVKNELSRKVTRQILELSEKYPDNYYIISSRPLDEFIGWSQFKELKSLPLSKQQALSLIDKLDYEPNIKSKFYDELKNNLFDKYETFASNPLLLTIMLLTFQSRVSIPDKVKDFFEVAFSTLFHEHDARKEAYKRDILSKLSYEEFKAVFSRFCFKSFFKSDYEFSYNKILEYIRESKKKVAKDGLITNEKFNSEDYLKDLTDAVCVIVHEGLDYIFTHRSFQEYFAALYTTQLDDDTQKRFLGKWLQENSYRKTSNYLDLLYELQPERFIKNLVSPAIKELESMYEQNGKSNVWLITFLYEGVGLSYNEEYEQKQCPVFCKEYYYGSMIWKVCRIGGYYKNVRIQNNEKEANLITLLEEYYNLNAYDYEGESVSFDEIMEDGFMEIALSGLGCCVDEYNFAVNFVNEFENQSLSDTDSFDDMLDEL
ncbi:MAG: hypothetical protein UH241_08780 [Acutalibacteraceae bacterium]|nr:hypothetical protein [Acutalibacteraceae bacterium]